VAGTRVRKKPAARTRNLTPLCPAALPLLLPLPAIRMRDAPHQPRTLGLSAPPPPPPPRPLPLARFTYVCIVRATPRMLHGSSLSPVSETAGSEGGAQPTIDESIDASKVRTHVPYGQPYFCSRNESSSPHENAYDVIDATYVPRYVLVHKYAAAEKEAPPQKTFPFPSTSLEIPQKKKPLMYDKNNSHFPPPVHLLANPQKIRTPPDRQNKK